MSSVNDPQPPLRPDVYDYPGAMVRLGHDAALFDEMVRFYLADSTTLMDRIRESSSQNNHADLALAAHTLLGLASNFGANRVTTSAAVIESVARNRASNSSADLHELASAVEELTMALRRHLEAHDSVRSNS